MENTEKRWHKNPMVWFIIAIPSSAIVLGIVMITLAIVTDDGLVDDDYYKQGLGINSEIGRDQYARDHHIGARLTINKESGVVTVILLGGGLDEKSKELTVRFLHATRSDVDVEIVLTEAPGNQYVGHVETDLSHGVWNVELGNAQWRVNSRMTNWNENIKTIDLL